MSNYYSRHTGQQIDDGIDAIGDIQTKVNTFTNRNLLDNPWFTINQRGVTTKTVTREYCVDRWICANSNYAKTNYGIEVTPNTSGYGLQQVIDDSLLKDLEDKTVTFSLMTNSGRIYVHTFVYKNNSGYQTGFSIEEFFNLYIANSSIWITGEESKTLHAKSVKLEFGSVSTLANDIEPNYAEELLKCQRYYYRLSFDDANIVGESLNVGYIWYIHTFNFPVRMCAKPSLHSYGNFTVSSNNGSLSVTAIAQLSASATSTDKMAVCFTVNNSTTGYGYIRGSNGAYLEFTADL